MEVRIVTLDTSVVGDLEELYNKALALVDDESKIHLQKYYHRVDSTTPLNPPVGYNITHDNGVVGMALSSGDDLYPDPPAYRVGLDVMRLHLDKRDNFSGFVEIFSEQLTSRERLILLPKAPSSPLSSREQLRRFYLIWTLKEAYTKALGLGMGFDFSRIEYDVFNDAVRIDGAIPRGWNFIRFEFTNEFRGREEEYVGVIAQYTGSNNEAKVEERSTDGGWFKVQGAAQFLERCLEEFDPV
ncbi:uncharacterized protein BXZ73DRAFT_97165 [Epithele typhae]|uniref:uncharacterized protein n=1 Tax=Epithele typhae TaxID=378194 RepID=UPI00200753C4|nr:uncharacterized protein BXZ73DRAFT_97165 [Epithele typhae]KAH9943110.1 hypothetical protein BXZ73DRAFT_97165 [Epithele typhae]